MRVAGCCFLDCFLQVLNDNLSVLPELDIKLLHFSDPTELAVIAPELEIEL